MNSPSPPQEAEHIRHQQLTPESPRPQNVPSPANIPILVDQMDLNYTAPDIGNSNPEPETSFPSQSHAVGAPSSTPYLPEQPFALKYNSVGSIMTGGGVSAEFPHTSAYVGSMVMQASGTPFQSFNQPQLSSTASASDSAHPPGQNLSSAYPFSNDNAYAPQSAQNIMFQNGAQAGPIVDVQALLDSLTPSANIASPGQYATTQMSALSSPMASNISTLPAATSNLPPRPPAQEKPTTHPNYNPTDDIRSFHPHSQRSSNAQPRANSQLPLSNVQRQDFPALPRTGPQSPTTTGQSQRRSTSPDHDEDENQRWPPEINRKFEGFLEQERKFVTDGQWDQFPLGSRLFIGNLPTEKVTKRDIFHRFYRHGLLAQISIKQAYGFVQFMDAEACRRALNTEQGQTVRGRKMHLEISKPQRNTKSKVDSHNNNTRRRSRSPDYTRGGSGPSIRDGRYGAMPAPVSPRDKDRRFRERDDYRPMRSPSPRRGSRGMGPRDRSRDRYDGRYRSRSRSPPRRRRSPSPRGGYSEDGLELPRRLPHEVPDIQIIVLNESLPRDFIRFVEDVFRSQNLRSNVLILSGRFSEPDVVRRQIIEGVQAIVRLDTMSLTKGKISVQIFDRRGGANDVQFNEYADLDPMTVGMLVNQAKQGQSQPVQPPTPAYGFPNQPIQQYLQPAPNAFPPAPASQPNVSGLISSLDPASLSQLLTAMSGNPNAQTNLPPPQTPSNPSLNADLARLLSQVPSVAHAPAPNGPAQAQLASLSNPHPGLASLLAGQVQQAPPLPMQAPLQAAAAPDMTELMAQLAQYQHVGLITRHNAVSIDAMEALTSQQQFISNPVFMQIAQGNPKSAHMRHYFPPCEFNV